jgi:capsule polysaccharide export protein KpsE/RkpR
MIGAIIEFILIFLVFVFHILVVTFFSTMITVVKSIEDGSADLKGAIRDPIGSMSKVPGRIKSEIGTIKNYVGETSRQIGKVRNLSR